MKRYDFKIEKTIIKRINLLEGVKEETKIKNVHVYAKSLEDAKTIVIGLGYKILEEKNND